MDWLKVDVLGRRYERLKPKVNQNETLLSGLSDLTGDPFVGVSRVDP